MFTISHRAFVIVIALAAQFTSESKLFGQGITVPRGPHGEVPVFFLVVDSIQYKGADAVIVRRASAAPHDLVLLKRSMVQARILAEAVHTLAFIRAKYGDDPAADAVYRVTDHGKPLPREAEAADWAASLKTGRRHQFDPYGLVPVLGVALPTQHPLTGLVTSNRAAARP